MGNTCSCWKNDNHIQFEIKNPLQQSKKTNLEDMKQYDSQIIKIQSWTRGILARQKIWKIQLQKYNDNVNEQLQAYSATLVNLRQREPFQFGQDDLGDANFYLKQLRAPTKLENGSLYFGEWVGDVRLGKGILICDVPFNTQIQAKDGSKYEGYFLSGYAHGRGRLVHSNGEYYEGIWNRDQASGFGTYFHQDGATYEGQWEKDLQSGMGVEKWPDGSNFEGLYLNGKKHGIGKFQWADGSIYTGEFRSNNIHGQGTYIWPDGRSFEGCWVNNKREGHGYYRWPDGKLYSGQFLNDQKSGFGVLQFTDGKRYEGDWVNDKQHGNGQLIYTDGNIQQGQWVNGIKNNLLDTQL